MNEFRRRDFKGGFSCLISIAGFDLSFSSPVVKIYLFATLFWVNKDKSM